VVLVPPPRPHACVRRPLAQMPAQGVRRLRIVGLSGPVHTPPHVGLLRRCKVHAGPCICCMLRLCGRRPCAAAPAAPDAPAAPAASAASATSTAAAAATAATTAAAPPGGLVYHSRRRRGEGANVAPPAAAQGSAPARPGAVLHLQTETQRVSVSVGVILCCARFHVELERVSVSVGHLVLCSLPCRGRASYPPLRRGRCRDARVPQRAGGQGARVRGWSESAIPSDDECECAKGV
jgi:hypothetical protein